jgi:cyanate permease
MFDRLTLVSDLEKDTPSASRSNHKWFTVTLAGLTATLVVAMPSMAMPVLFSEISETLGLSLVQVGAIWGTGSLAGVFTSLAGGSIGDRFGTKRTLTVSCLAVGLAGALRGLSTGFASLAATVFLTGLVVPIIPVNLHKACSVWFSGRHRGLANGVVAVGMAFGFVVGSMVSATLLSPWLGGWRHVLFFYGAVAMLMSIPWAFAREAPDGAGSPGRIGSPTSIRRALAHVVRLRDVWLLGATLIGVSGCTQGMLGYLPLYLREVGWSAARADAVLASFHAMSLVSVIPISLLSDRLGSRKRLLVLATVMIATGIGLLAIANGPFVWFAALMAGAVRDGYMALFMTMVTESDGVGALYAGTAMGLTLTLSRVGGLIAPPVGNSLAAMDLRLPFVFWAAMAVMGCYVFSFVKEGKAQEARPDHVALAGS